MKRTLAALVGAVSIMATVPAVASASSSAIPGSAALAAEHTHFSGTIVIDWNRELLSILKTPGAQPATIHPTRSLAILHAAMYDAVVSITGDAPAYLFKVRAPEDARPDAAAAQAGHDTLTALYPTMKPALDQFATNRVA
jgi:hypothetical protein